MENRFFSLVIVPDSGNEVRQSSFNLHFAAYLFGALAATFLVCAFFIIGYHVKLFQEKEFKNAISRLNTLQAKVTNSQHILDDISERLEQVKKTDVAFRAFAYMNTLDPEMYKAGVGGHAIVDESILGDLTGPLKSEVKQVLYDATTLANRVSVQEASLIEVDRKIKRNIEEINATPSILPTHSLRITSGFGYRIHPTKHENEFHDAVDIGGRLGQTINATADGVVVFAGYAGNLGNCVRVQHAYGYETTYGHLSAIKVVVGQRVKREEVIGLMGRTGRATGVHVHYAISHFNIKVNPKKYF